MTKGHHLIQLIYDAYDSLTDCEYVSDKDMVHSFVETFTSDYHLLSDGSTTLRTKSLRLVRNSDDIPADMAVFVDYAALRLQCRKLHQRIRRNGAHQLGQGLASRLVPLKFIQLHRLTRRKKKGSKNNNETSLTVPV